MSIGRDCWMVAVLDVAGRGWVVGGGEGEGAYEFI